MVNGRYAQVCVQSPRNVFEQFNFSTGAVDRYAADSGLFSLCWTGEAGREMQKERFATRESDASS